MRVPAVAAALAASLMSGAATVARLSRPHRHGDRALCAGRQYRRVRAHHARRHGASYRPALRDRECFRRRRHHRVAACGKGRHRTAIRCWSARWARMRRLSVSMATSSATIRSTTSSMSSQFAGTPIGIFVKKDFPAITLQELIARLKSDARQTHQRPRRRRLDLASQLPAVRSRSIGNRATAIGYRGSGPALNDLITGQYDFLCDQIPHTVGHVQAGIDPDARDRAARTRRRCAERADHDRGRTAADAGPGWNAMFAPKGTPKAIVDKLAGPLERPADDPVTRKRLEDIGACGSSAGTARDRTRCATSLPPKSPDGRRC